MNLPSYIKPYPKLFKYLPISDQGFTPFCVKTIYLSKSIIADLQKPEPQPLSLAVLKHQEIHAKNPNILKTLRFILFKKYRIEEETRAFTVMFHILKKYNQTFDLNHVAREFSQLRYLWMTSYEEGQTLIQKIWDEA